MKKFLIFLGLFILIIIVSGFSTYKIDQYRISKDQSSIFTIPLIHVKDGGTTISFGIGYQVIDWNQVDFKLVDGVEIVGHYKGSEIFSIFNLKYIPFFTHNFKPDKELPFIPY